MESRQMTFDLIETLEPRNHYKTRALKLREQAVAARTFEDMNEDDILTTIVGFVNQTERAQEIAHSLLDAFGSLRGVLEARPEMLRRVNGVGEKMAAMISFYRPMFGIWNRITMEQPDRIGNSRDAEKYCVSLLAGYRNEMFYVISLNARCLVNGKRRISEGSLSEVSAYPRMIAETALNHNAHSVLLCHNHPGGTCAPSPEDIASTLQIQRLLNGLGILVLDHIIVAGSQTYSMIQHGDIDYRTKGR